MSLIVDAFQGSIVKSYINMNGRLEHTPLADVLTRKGVGFDLEFEDVSESIKIDFREPGLVAEAIGSDACRFASAAFVTMRPIETEIIDKTCLPWSLVKLYYAAFYAGHSILRLLGQSCTNLEGRHTQKIRDFADAIEAKPAFAIQAGLYHWMLSDDQAGFSMSRASGNVGGTHEAFWVILGRFVEGWNEKVLQSYLTPADAATVFAKLNAFVGTLKYQGSAYNWLSKVRNEIQYKHANKVWIPSPMRRADREELQRSYQQWTRDPLDIDVEYFGNNILKRFVMACSFLVALCRAIMRRIADRSEVSAKSFVSFSLAHC